MIYNPEKQIDVSRAIERLKFFIKNKRVFELTEKRNKEKFSNQCRIVYEALLRGERLTTTTALLNYRIGGLSRRIKDLKDFWNVPIESEMIEGNYKEYFLINNNQ